MYDVDEFNASFENELNSLFDPLGNVRSQSKSNIKKENPVNKKQNLNIDFGFGVAKPLASNQFYLSNGIVI